jgi:hypothetical protein
VVVGVGGGEDGELQRVGPLKVDAVAAHVCGGGGQAEGGGRG